jgi:hypothetical protein
MEAAKQMFPGGQIDAGMKVSDRAFLSTSKSSSEAGMRGIGGVVLQIEVGKGANGLDMEKLSRNPSEQEVLLPRDAKLTVLGTKPGKTPGAPVVVRVRYGDA